MLRATLFRRRPGFTLVELLVVIALFVLLLALGAAVYPNLANSQKVVRSADRLSGWLLIAKARAKRDEAPRGVRVYLTQPDPTNNPTRVEATECQYIEAPMPWNPNPTGNPVGGRVVFVQMVHRDNTTVPPTDTVPHDEYKLCYFVGTDPELLEFDQRVRIGDHLFLPEYGSSHRILDLQGTNNMNGSATPPLVGLGTPPAPTTARALRLETYPHLGAAHSGPMSQTPTVPNPGRAPLPPTGPNTYLTTMTPPGTLVTFSYAFQSAPRTLLGEPILMLGTDSVIDWRQGRTQASLGGAPVDGAGYRDWSTPNTGAANGPPYHPSTTIGLPAPLFPPPTPTPPPAFLDILFAPSGQVLNNPNGLICLWLRDREKVAHPRLDAAGNVDPLAEYNTAGEQVLILINTRSGLISTKPVVEPPAGPVYGFDPYQYAKDGLDTGL